MQVKTIPCRKSKKITKQYGIIPKIKHVSKGKYISKEIQAYVEGFYWSDNISRICAGKKDCISMWNAKKGVKESTKKTSPYEFKGNLYLVQRISWCFKNCFLKLCQFKTLKPKNCILTVGKAGTHTVCVCYYHQNVKL